jgi:ketosteroid isomerase-like protein
VSQDSAELLIRKVHDRWLQGDFATPEFFDPDVEFVLIGADAVGAPGEWRGIDALWAVLVDWFQAWDDYRIEATRFISRGNQVLVIQRHTARGRESGLRFDHEIGLLTTVRNSKIVRLVGYWNKSEAIDAIDVNE